LKTGLIFPFLLLFVLPVAPVAARKVGTCPESFVFGKKNLVPREELLRRRIAWIRKHHAEFAEIDARQNKEFIELVKRLDAGNEKNAKAIVIVENAVLKELNDTVVEDKDLVTVLGNLYKQVLHDAINKDPYLSARRVVGEYNDFKTIGLAVTENNAYFRKQLDRLLGDVNRRYGEYLTLLDRELGWSQKARGLAAKQSNWHPAGIGGTFNEAGLAARRGRTSLDGQGNTRLVNFLDGREYFLGRLADFDAEAKRLLGRYAKIPGMTETLADGRSALSVEAIETIRKAKPKGEGAVAANRAVRDAIGERFRKKISDAEAEELRKYLSLVDSFSPGLLQEERVVIDMSNSPDGIISFDFTRQNARNLFATQAALLNTRGQSMASRRAAISAGERDATEFLNSMKESVADRVLALGRGARDFLQFSGDDGIFRPRGLIDRPRKQKIVRQMLDDKLAGNIRLTFLPPSYISGKPIPTDKKYLYIGEAEGIEKKLRPFLLARGFGREAVNGLQIAVDFQPVESGAHEVEILLDWRERARIPVGIRKAIQDFLREDNYVVKGVSQVR
jgi:hypothetical protein